MVKMQLRAALSNFTPHVLYLNFVDMDNSPYTVVHVNTTYLLLEKAYQMWLKSLERIEACCVDQIRVLSSVKVEPYSYCDLITDYCTPTNFHLLKAMCVIFSWARKKT